MGYNYQASIRGERIWGKLLAVYCACLIISNVLAAKIAVIGSFTLPCGVLIFPVVYILNDVMAEVFPLDKVRKGIFMGFGLNLLAVVCFEIAIVLPGFTDNAFGEVLGSSWRVLLASFTAYLIGSTCNATVMSVLHKKSGERRLFFRCIASTIVGETLDAFIFISIAFFGTMDNTILFTMICTQALFKILYEVVVFPLTNVVIRKVKKLVY
jgi:uncharacterized integral membrane protein (TIGR00697 family)